MTRTYMHPSGSLARILVKEPGGSKTSDSFREILRPTPGLRMTGLRWRATSHELIRI
jgi:hypothetical protein